MKDQWLSVPEITALMESFNKNKLGEFLLRSGENEITLKSRETVPAAPIAAAPLPEQAQMPGEAVTGDGDALQGTTVKSPIVGTFYASPAPEKPVFVKVGQQVKKGDVLFIIESMKLMNEVVSEYDGEVTKIFVQNEQAVEYGQPILQIE